MKRAGIIILALIALSLVTYKYRRLEPIRNVRGKVENFFFPASVVYFGDSITVGCDLPSISRDKSHHTFARNGFSTKHMLDIMNSYPNYENAKVYILLGANDVRLRYSLREIEEYYRKLIKRIRQSNTNMTLFLQAVFPVLYNPRYPQITNERIEQVNELIQKIAEAEKAHFLDITMELKGQDGQLKREYTTDGIHLSLAGCKKWYDKLSL